MKRGTFTLISLLLSGVIMSGCATIIGGFSSTAEASGDNMGPATLIESNVTLNNDKFEALTSQSDLTATKLVIGEDLKIKGNANLTKVTVKNTTTIGGSLTSDDSTFKGSVKVGGNISTGDSYFAKGIEFAGTSLQLSNSTKVIGQIISSNPQPVTIIIDHSKLEGNIGFANSASNVILRNGGELKGTLLNGKLQQE